MATRTEPHQYFVADGTRGAGDLVDLNAVPDEDRAVAAAHRVIGQLGHVDAGERSVDSTRSLQLIAFQEVSPSKGRGLLIV